MNQAVKFEDPEQEFTWQYMNISDLDIRSKSIYDRDIYHYTTPEGFMGITKGKKVTLWFSRYDMLNDASEGRDIEDIYQAVCKNLLSSKKIDDDFYDSIEFENVKVTGQRLFSMPDWNNGGITQISLERCSTYVCSFSSEDDSLAMWNSYVKDGDYLGYSLKFSTDIFSKQDEYRFTKSNLPCGNLEILRVVYSREGKFKLLTDKILAAYDLQEKGIAKNRIIAFLRNVLLSFQLAFKNYAFRHENELRAIMHIPEFDKAPKGIRTYDVHFRNKNGFIIPYIEVEVSPLSCFRQVRLCPLINDIQVKKSMEGYLRANGFFATSVENSEVPIRY